MKVVSCSHSRVIWGNVFILRGGLEFLPDSKLTMENHFRHQFSLERRMVDASVLAVLDDGSYSEDRSFSFPNLQLFPANSIHASRRYLHSPLKYGVVVHWFGWCGNRSATPLDAPGMATSNLESGESEILAPSLAVTRSSAYG